VSLVASVREYVNSLVHPSARNDRMTAARHRGFIVPRVLGGFLAMAALPVYLVARGTPTPPEIALCAWLLAPVAIAYFLSLTGRYETAHVLSALALLTLASTVASLSGGIASPAAVWLALVPFEAALSASRRVVITASAATLAAVVTLCLVGNHDSAWLAASGGALRALAGITVGSAALYAALLALGAESLTRIGSELLSVEEQRYQLLAQHMTDVISRHGRGGAVLSISAAAETVFGAPPHNLIGHGLFDLVHVADRPAYLTALADAARDTEPRSVDFRVRRVTAETDAPAPPHFVWIEMRCHSLGEVPADSAAEGHEVVAVLRDVTRRKQQEEALEAAHTEAEQTNAAKGRFLATMSHELRTPLNAVIGFSEMLMQEEAMRLDAARRHDYARLIHDSGHHLLSVVNLVLDMSKLENGKFVITPEPFAPAPVIRNCCDLLALRAREAGIDIVMRLAPDLPELSADRRALKQMLLNLLSNAVKFTGSGGEVTVTATADADAITIAVADTGVGIGAEDLARVGDPFFQARGSYDRPYEGTGLGLSIVKGLVSLHGGELQIDSRLGVGTCVTIRLPLDCEPQTATIAPLVAMAGSSMIDTTPPAAETPHAEAMQVKRSA
jgi:cell cycle sensor histidine kinase DivJ